jgi:hypothetical protein
MGNKALGILLPTLRNRARAYAAPTSRRPGEPPSGSSVRAWMTAASLRSIAGADIGLDISVAAADDTGSLPPSTTTVGRMGARSLGRRCRGRRRRRSSRSCGLRMGGGGRRRRLRQRPRRHLPMLKSISSSLGVAGACSRALTRGARTRVCSSSQRRRAGRGAARWTDTRASTPPSLSHAGAPSARRRSAGRGRAAARRRARRCEV